MRICKNAGEPLTKLISSLLLQLVDASMSFPGRFPHSSHLTKHSVNDMASAFNKIQYQLGRDFQLSREFGEIISVLLRIHDDFEARRKV